MKKLLLSAAVASCAIAAPASAATFVNVGDSVNLTFNGTQAGTSATLLLTLTGKDTSSNLFTFSYVLTNTSNLALNPTSRVRNIGFDDIGVDTQSASVTTADSNGFNNAAYDENFPDGLGNREFCFTRQPGGCNGGNSGATVGDPATGSFALNYNGNGWTSLTLDNFAVRYQSTGTNSQGSGTGVSVTTAVPEPATWAMMLLGFGLVGAALRRRNTVVSDARVRFA